MVVVSEDLVQNARRGLASIHFSDVQVASNNRNQGRLVNRLTINTTAITRTAIITGVTSLWRI